MEKTISFETRTGTVSIHTDRCPDCPTFACVKACSLYGSGIIRITDARPVLNISPSEAKHRCVECLACELGCQIEGFDVVDICLPIPGLETQKVV